MRRNLHDDPMVVWTVGIAVAVVLVSAIIWVIMKDIKQEIEDSKAENDVSDAELLQELRDDMEITPYRCGHLGCFFWQQYNDNIELTCTVGKDVKGKDVHTTFKKNQLEVAIKGRTVLQGSLFLGVDADACFWQFDTKDDGSKHLEITLQKLQSTKPAYFWEGVFKDPKEIVAVESL